MQLKYNIRRYLGEFSTLCGYVATNLFSGSVWENSSLLWIHTQYQPKLLQLIAK